MQFTFKSALINKNIFNKWKHCITWKPSFQDQDITTLGALLSEANHNKWGFKRFPSENKKRVEWAHQLVLWVNVVQDSAVLHGTLHSTGPKGLGNRCQRDKTLTATLCQHVTLHLLATRLCHVRTVVHHKDCLVRHREHLWLAQLQYEWIWERQKKKKKDSNSSWEHTSYSAMYCNCNTDAGNIAEIKHERSRIADFHEQNNENSDNRNKGF